ncbi:glutaredoxin family protein [Hyunsoonleella sp. SJ7]|uniref:Glutaredoxin family protein n=1 Tax=Hyunsoonleella aquatilis TaxID=2762758 RepID=A0A923H9J5_9FLAO|nr:glutaredoxin family protein [Hyunsoonleella aquatilis]MBC3756884.1 glutaredoxin family protein [Hyunsoonleella aquatilis]
MRWFVFSVMFFLTSVVLCYAQEHTSAKNGGTESLETPLIVYGSDTCHYCLDTKAHLKKHKIAFVYFDVDQNKVKEREMVEKLRENNIPLHNLSLPVVEKEGQIIMNSGVFGDFLKKLTVK